MSCTKKQKCLENDLELDHISALPDALLCHILSFVPTKSAVATSVLSRRWISLWTKVPVLDFTKLPLTVTYRDCEKANFKRFLEKMLIRNDISCLQRFHFEILSDLEMDSLINSFLRREISDIYLSKEWDGPNILRFPMDIFARERLEVLKLRHYIEFNVPLSMYLPRIESLYLHDLKFVGNDVLKIDKSGCPVLKELVIEYFKGIKKIIIDSLSLNRLKINRNSAFVYVRAPNVRYLDLSVGKERVDISEFSSLVEARVSLGYYNSNNQFGYYNSSNQLWKLGLLRRFSDVQILWLSQYTVEMFGSFSENELPIFPKLIRLEIHIAHSMFQMLKYTPNLVNLIVDVGISIRLLSADETRPFPSEIVPQCLSSIPIIEIRNFGDFVDDTELVRYIFKNAAVLKELKIHMHRASVKEMHTRS